MKCPVCGREPDILERLGIRVEMPPIRIRHRRAWWERLLEDVKPEPPAEEAS